MGESRARERPALREEPPLPRVPGEGRAAPSGRGREVSTPYYSAHQGAHILSGGGPQEPRADARAGGQAAEQGEELQEADRGGRGDRRPQPRQVPQGPG